MGKEVFQLAVGRNYWPQITPTYALPFVFEYHEKCFSKGALRYQEQPYKCQICGNRIANNEEVIYGVIGQKPGPGCVRPECRGHGLYLVAHPRCLERRLAELG
jgi:hypothetical protein